MAKFDFGNYKLIACDMDGTFLGSDHKIPALNKDVVRICKENNINFAVCTGRAVAALGGYMDVLGDSAMLITYNGAKIIDRKQNREIIRQSLFESDVEKIYNLSLKFDTTLVAWADEKLYINKNNEHAKRYANLSWVDYVYFEDYREFMKILPNGRTNIDKMFWNDTEERAHWLYDNAKELVPKTVGFFGSGSGYLEFVSAEANKGNGIKLLCEYLNITRDQVVAFGDEENDLPMMEFAGLPVAMANGATRVKAMAKRIAPSNDEAGVYQEFIKIFER